VGCLGKDKEWNDKAAGNKMLFYTLVCRGLASSPGPELSRLLAIGITIVDPTANLRRVPSHDRETRDIL
jgi:hypothetical protein